MTGAGDARLAEALGGEHAAIYAYGVLGVRLRGAQAASARAAEAEHRDRRDAALLHLSTAGAEVPAAEPAYALPFPVTDAAAACRLAVVVEERAAGLWRAALAVTEGPGRALALDGLTRSAVWATRWRRAAGPLPWTVPYPGRPR
ncbi:MAG TPA: ferritin-like domain-containing protein [Pilimelia sp.]|nr:ferritin-like domain-containing protein [Pilimelia sp.]